MHCRASETQSRPLALLLLLVVPVRAATPRSPAGAAAVPPKQLWVVNVSTVPTNLVSLFQTASGVVNREGAADRVLLVGLAADQLKAPDIADAAGLSLTFLRQRYAAELAYDRVRDLQSDPWQLFELPFVRRSVTHAVEIGSADAPQAIYAALTVASVHGHAAVLHCSPSERAEVLEKTGLQPISSVLGLFTDMNRSCAAVNAFVARQLSDVEASANLSNSMFATWGQTVKGVPTQGFDYVVHVRMLAFCMDSSAVDWSTTQRDILEHFPRGKALPFGFGWWTNEGTDIVALSSLGFSWLGGGHNLGLYSLLPPLPLQPPTAQPRAPLPATIGDDVALAVFSFTQGDAASFDQKFVRGQRVFFLLTATEPGLTSIILLFSNQIQHHLPFANRRWY